MFKLKHFDIILQILKTEKSSSADVLIFFLFIFILRIKLFTEMNETRRSVRVTWQTSPVSVFLLVHA